MNVKHSYLLALFISITVLLSSCAAGAMAFAIADALPVAIVGGAAVAAGGPGVAANQPKQPFISEIDIKSNKLVSIKTIALLKIPDPPFYGRDNALDKNPGEFEEFSFSKTSQEILKQQLEEYGFEVVEYHANRENKTRLIFNYANLDTNVADAYLDVVPAEIEYNLQGPHVSAVFRLVLADPTEIIYAGSIQYEWGMDKSISSIRIESPEDYSYESSKALIKNKEEVIERLVQGVEVVSWSIAQEIGMGKVNGTIAAKEIDTETYDKNLWAKALVETGGDQNKTKARYIELRANQLYSEKVGSVSDASLYQQTVSVTPSTQTNLSGTYVSAITSSHHFGVLKKKQQQTMKLIVKHEGDSLKAYNNQYDLEIIGEVVGNKVSFYTLPGKISSNEITGIWEVDVDSGGITGRWKTEGRGFLGQWNLLRIRTVTEVEYTSSGEKYTESIETPVLASESSPGDEKSALDYRGQAEEEINTQTYDKNLWAKALVETGGDQNKTKAKYIELRANQLYSEKVGSVSDASLSQQANPTNTTTQINISGTYVSDITSSTHSQFTKRSQKLRVTFEQSGNKFTATDDKYDIKIDGTIVDNTIRFYVLAGPAIGAYDVEGEWNISLDGKKLEGFWEAPNSHVWAAGTWTLNKVE